MAVISYGSINMDLVGRTPRFASPGETLVGKDFYAASGGKGANQAVAAGRLGVDSYMFGQVGTDLFGEDLLKNLQGNNVCIEGVKKNKKNPTGTALITVDDNAENTIIINPGANGENNKADANNLVPFFSNDSILMLQLEIPLDCVISAAHLARENGVKVLLDPAPACELPDELLELCHFISPNETEAEILSGINIRNIDDARKAADILLKRKIGAVIIKMSSAGSFYSDGINAVQFPGYTVDAVDTVAAGDAFNGGFAAAFSEKKPLIECLQWANACGALSTTKFGAQPSMPTREELLFFIDNNPNV
jgi:ribokinase